MESIPAGWSADQELANWKVLKPEDVGPEWVVALRKAGQFPIEDDKSCYRAEPAKGEKRKRRKSDSGCRRVRKAIRRARIGG